MFRADDRIDHDQAMKQSIWAKVDSIEYHASRAMGRDIMAHELAWLAPRLKNYQDDKYKLLAFYNWLCKIVDAISAGNFDWSRGPIE